MRNKHYYKKKKVKNKENSDTRRVVGYLPIKVPIYGSKSNL